MVFALIFVQEISVKRCNLFPFDSIFISIIMKLAYRAEMQLLVIFYIVRIGVMLNLLAKRQTQRQKKGGKKQRSRMILSRLSTGDIDRLHVDIVDMRRDFAKSFAR